METECEAVSRAVAHLGLEAGPPVGVVSLRPPRARWPRPGQSSASCRRCLLLVETSVREEMCSDPPEGEVEMSGDFNAFGSHLQKHHLVSICSSVLSCSLKANFSKGEKGRQKTLFDANVHSSGFAPRASRGAFFSVQRQE